MDITSGNTITKTVGNKDGFMTRMRRLIRSVYSGFVFSGLQVSVDYLVIKYVQPLYPHMDWQSFGLFILARVIPSFVIFVVLVDLLLEKQAKIQSISKPMG